MQVQLFQNKSLYNNIFNNNSSNQNNLVQFTGYQKTIEKALDEVIISHNTSKEAGLGIVELLRDNLSKIISDKNLLGEGLENYIYKLSRKYVLKIPRGYIDNKLEIPSMFNLVDRLFADVKNYYGEPLAQLSDIKILPNLGKSTAVGTQLKINKDINLQRLEEQYLTKYLPKAASLPQVAYDELAHYFDKFNRFGLGGNRGVGPFQFDCLNPNNLVIKNNRFYLVDDLNTASRTYTNTTAKLLNMLLCRMTAVFTSPTTDESAKYARKILEKMLLASQKENMLIVDKGDLAFLREASTKIKMDENAFFEMLGKLDGVCAKFKTPEERVNASKPIIAEAFANNPIK